MIMKLLIFPTVVLFSSCVAAVFPKIQPGMSTSEIRTLGDEGPSHVVPYESNAQAWFYGDDQCILVVNDHVLLKERTQTRVTASIPGVASMRQQTKAACYPPGMETGSNQETQILIPGVGGAIFNSK
jgi:hypothetical protein